MRRRWRRDGEQLTRDPLLSVELRHLAALAAIARTGSFHEAAKSLGYAQSAVSQQIALLERIVGARLVNRSRGSSTVTLTEAGEVLLRHAESIIAALQAARADLTALTDDAPAVFRLGVAQATTGRLLARIMPVYTARRSTSRIVPYEARSEALLLDLVERGEVHAALVELPIRAGPFTTVELLADPYVLIVGENSRLASLGRPLLADEWLSLELIVPKESHRLRDRLQARGVSLAPASHEVDEATAKSLVAAGFGVAVVSRLAADPPFDGTATVELGDLLPPRRLGLCWHARRQVDEVVSGLCEAAKTVCS